MFAGTDRAEPSIIDPGRLEAHVRTLSETLGPRDAGHPDNLNRVASYIRLAFEQAQGKTADQPFQVGQTTYRNVVATFGPQSKERVVVGAHYDTAGPYPGADDNASGIAGLIELAGLVSKNHLPSRVDLVAYTLEEPPFFRTEHMGSAVHARALKAEGAIVRAMLSLEMIGYFTDEEDSQSFPAPGLSLLYPTTGNFIAVVGRIGEGRLVRRIKNAMSNASSLPVHSINAPRFLAGIDFSDHLNYWEAGYPAVMITDTAFYRNPNYHTATDTAETLDYRRMAQVAAGIYAAVRDLAR
ncbi:M28 family peptidase [Methylocaldum sp.]|uniref:M28 family peptidase n=1 Tax=Methylocaldum sp. TaxID=1969727 RepID=UPI002D385B26|nr:M28 family peptidase [Methylocaldum sp.]HYE34206.1 M28 family peptidase [Methylocaldum sp.]